MCAAAANLLKPSLPLYSFKSSGAKLAISQRTTNSNVAAAALIIKVSPWRLLAAHESKINLGTEPPREVPSVPPEVPQISRTPEVDPFNAPPEFTTTTTTDPPPLGRPSPDPGPDFPEPPVGPPPIGPEIPVPPPGRQTPPEVDLPKPPDHVPPPATPPEYVPPDDNPTPGIPPEIPPTTGPSFVF